MNWLTKLLPSKVEGDDIYSLEFLSARLMGTSELSIVEAQRELVRFGKQVNKAYSYLSRILLEADARAQMQFLQQIERIERITDKMEIEIADYLSQISSTEISPRASGQIRAILAASNYLERSCDLILKIGSFMVRSKKEKAYFTPELRQTLVSFMSLVQEDLINELERLGDHVERVSRELAFGKEKRNAKD